MVKRHKRPSDKINSDTKKVIGVATVLLFILLLFLQKGEVVFAFNNTYSHASILFWRTINMLGDGIIFAYLAPFILLNKYRRLLYLALLVVLQTIIVQAFKRGFADGMARPFKYFDENYHYILNVGQHVDIHLSDTFPSGHATTAFTVGFFLMLYLKKTHQQLMVFAIVFVAAMARVYLAQHFFIDIVAGLVVSITTMVLADIFYKRLKIYKVRGSLITTIKRLQKKHVTYPQEIDMSF